MGATTENIFGNAGGDRQATPGAYGEAPPGYRLPDGTQLGVVRLQVSDLQRSVAFYEHTLGLRAIERTATRALLAAHEGKRALLELNERAGATPAPRRGRVGLFHFAILLPDRAALGRFVQHLGHIGAQAGSADHLVSEAFYLQDPDNLGIEVYADRPRNSWRQVGRELMMATDPADIQGIVAAGKGEAWTGMPAGTVMGHVHLHVGDIAQASRYYSDALGFDRMVWHYPGALFFGAGGYHHHLGTNIWAGSNAKPAGPDEAQLLEWTIELPTDRDVEQAQASLLAAGFQARSLDSAEGTTVATTDPWGTQIRIRSVTG